MPDVPSASERLKAKKAAVCHHGAPRKVDQGTMLRRLSITNYLLIESLELDLNGGLTIITGETGSGKNILIGALALAMGERARSGVQRDPTKRCVIELEVDLEGIDIADRFISAEIPMERNTILRRQIEPGGRSRAFVNDTPVKLEQLRELGERGTCSQPTPHVVAERPSVPIGPRGPYGGPAGDGCRICWSLCWMA